MGALKQYVYDLWEGRKIWPRFEGDARGLPRKPKKLKKKETKEEKDESTK